MVPTLTAAQKGEVATPSAVQVADRSEVRESAATEGGHWAQLSELIAGLRARPPLNLPPLQTWPLAIHALMGLLLVGVAVAGILKAHHFVRYCFAKGQDGQPKMWVPLRGKVVHDQQQQKQQQLQQEWLWVRPQPLSSSHAATMPLISCRWYSLSSRTPARSPLPSQVSPPCH